MRKKITKNYWKRSKTSIAILLCTGILCTWSETQAASMTSAKMFSHFKADIVVKGVVSDKNGPLPGVTVSVKSNNQLTTVTNKNGAFSISVPENGVLIFKFIGYKTLEVPVDGKSVLNVTLEEANTSL